MTSTATFAPMPDLADELAAGRPYPLRDWQRTLDRAHLADLFEARRVWWLEVSLGFATLAENARAAGDLSVVDECLADARAAVASAVYYGAKVGA